MFIGTAAFEVLIKQQIKRLEDPSLKCVQMVYDELVRILNQLLQKQQFRRFPLLKERFYSVVNGYFKKALNPTNKFVTDVISAEACYINTAHPDFLSGHRAMAIVQEKITASKSGQSSVDPKILASAAAGQRPGAPMAPSPVPPAVPTLGGSEDPASGFFGSFFGKKKKGGPLEGPPPVLKASGNLSEREQVETEVISG